MGRFLFSGMSGSGKSTVARILEDVGFRVLRNLPPFLIKETLATAPQTHVAIFPEIKNGDDVAQFVESVREMNGTEVFLDASDETLLRRYKESRRPHPAQSGVALRDAILIERARLSALHKRAHHVVDTTKTTPAQLSDAIMTILGMRASRKLLLTFMSFGFKYGVPAEIDLCFDVRFLQNPYFIEHLRPLSGNDVQVSDFVLGLSETSAFLEKFDDMFGMLLPLYVGEGKNYLTVGIGCTGGRHRSVAIANEMTKRWKKADALVSTAHRDVSKESFQNIEGLAHGI